MTSFLDWTVIMVYFVGGRKLSWWAVGLSTMATQTSAISFISIPTFVALKAGGGLTWLQYELAVPLAIIVVMVFLIPLFREMQLVSVYEYLEFRYNRSVRQLVSGIFLVSRALGTEVVGDAQCSQTHGLTIKFRAFTIYMAIPDIGVLAGLCIIDNDGNKEAI